MTNILTSKETHRETYLTVAIRSARSELLEAHSELALATQLRRPTTMNALKAISNALSILESATRSKR